MNVFIESEIVDQLEGQNVSHLVHALLHQYLEHKTKVYALPVAALAPENKDRPLNTSLTAITDEGNDSCLGSIEFLHQCTKLKTTKRTGWIEHNVKEPESIAEHMYRLSIMALLLTDEEQELNVTKCIKMALVHDLAECVIGDLSPRSNVTKQEKQRLESNAMDTLTQMLRYSAPKAATLIRSLWQEYEDAKSIESLVLHDLDKLEMLVQALEYERVHNGQDLNDFFTSLEQRPWSSHPTVKKWALKLLEMRAKFLVTK